MRYNLVRLIVSLLMLMIAFLFESATGVRAQMIMALSVAYAVVPFLRGITHQKRQWTLALDCIILILLNYYSRYNINHLYILLYFFNICETILWLDREKSVVWTIFNAVSITICFKFLFDYGVNYQIASQTVFLGIIFSLYVGILFVYKSYLKSKQEAEKLNNRLKEQNEHLTQSNQALETTNDMLESANFEIARLTRLKERSELAKSLHDSVGHEVTGHIMALEMLKMKYQNQMDGAIVSELQEAIDRSREILRALRTLVSEHREIISHETFYDQLSKKTTQFQLDTGIAIYFEYQLYDEKISDELSVDLYHIVLESIANSAKHGRAKKIWISFQMLDTQDLLLKIMDNGKVEHLIKEGNGMSFIKARMAKYNGIVTFEGDEFGFRTTIRVPLSQQEGV